MVQNSKWTFMVYLAGDNNLEEYGTIDLEEMKRVGSTADLSLVAQFDRMSEQTTRRYHLTANQSLDADCVATLPETNTGDPQVLVDFEEVIALQVVGLPAGTYTVDVNGVKGTFTLTVDNGPS